MWARGQTTEHALRKRDRFAPSWPTAARRGRVFVGFEAFGALGSARSVMAVRSAPPDALPDADPIERAWSELQVSWDDEQAHRRFIAACATAGALPSAGRLYREVRDTDPARSAVARRQIDAVMAAALANLDLARAPRSTARRRLHWVAVGLSTFFVLYTVLSILRAHRP